MSSEGAFTQLVTASPAALPTGTRPDAMAPTTVPMKKGVTTEESPNARSASCRFRSRRAILWKAKPEPRRTIPSAARLSGMNSVDITDEKATENAVQSTTSAKTSQTWFASQTGPIAQSTKARARSPRSPVPANNAQKPAPKSAPPKTAYSVAQTHSTPAAASAALIRVPRHRVATAAAAPRSGRRAPRPRRFPRPASGAPSSAG